MTPAWILLPVSHSDPHEPDGLSVISCAIDALVAFDSLGGAERESGEHLATMDNHRQGGGRVWDSFSPKPDHPVFVARISEYFCDHRSIECAEFSVMKGIN